MEQRLLFGGKYIIRETLGAGNSKVYLAENTNLGTLWAVKQMRRNSSEVRVEPEILKRLEHPCLPRIFDVIEEEDFVYIIMEYIRGTSLDKLLERTGRMEEERVIKWAVSICEVLSYLHEMKPSPIIHRDIKPSNIIISNTGELKIIDFGTAREYKDAGGLDTVYIGTRGYAAPEQYGGGQTSPASDIYSLGVTMHHLLTEINPNSPPYRLMPVRDYVPEISGLTEEIIIKCTKSDPADRYSSAGELKSALLSKEKIHQKESTASKPGLTAHSTNLDKRVITIWDNGEFACELAYTAARLSGRTVLLADLDLLSPSADIYLNVRKFQSSASGSGMFGNTGLNIVLEAAEKKIIEGDIIKKAAVRRRELGNLYVLTGCYNLEDYEYYSNDCLIMLIDCAIRSFDIVILAVNRSIYDSYTVLSLDRSDINIFAVRPGIRELRDCNNWIAHLKQKQKITSDKYKYVMFDWNPDNSWQKEFVQKVMGSELIGVIRESSRRARYRNLKAAYVQKMEGRVAEDYRALLSKIGIMRKRSAAEAFAYGIKGLFLSKKSAGLAVPFFEIRRSKGEGGAGGAGNSNLKQHNQIQRQNS